MKINIGYLKGMLRVLYTIKDKEQDKEKDMNKARLIKILKVS